MPWLFDPKVDMVLFDRIFELFNIRGEQLVIWSRFNNEVSLISERLGVPFINGTITNKKRSDIINSFKNKEFPILSANPYCFAHGGNLSVAYVEVYYSLPESGLIFNQSKRRIFDIDQKQDKMCYYIVARNTLDEVILDAHKRKVSVVKTIFEYARRERMKIK